MRALVVATILLFPAEAYLSGSSVVTADSEWFSLQLESPRKRFHEDQDEAGWHREWRAKNQKRVEDARTRLAAIFPPLVKRYRLAKYRAELPLVEEGREGIAGEILESKKPFRYRLGINEFSVTVVYPAPPESEARVELKQALARALSSSE